MPCVDVNDPIGRPSPFTHVLVKGLGESVADKHMVELHRETVI